MKTRIVRKWIDCVEPAYHSWKIQYKLHWYSFWKDLPTSKCMYSNIWDDKNKLDVFYAEKCSTKHDLKNYLAFSKQCHRQWETDEVERMRIWREKKAALEDPAYEVRKL